MDRSTLLMLGGMLAGAVCISLVAVVGGIPKTPAVVASQEAPRAIARGTASLAFQPGSAAADFELTSAEGEAVRLLDLRGRYVGFFLRRNCPYCTQLEERIAEGMVQQGAQLIVICRGDSTDVAAISAAVGHNAMVLADSDGTVSEQFGVRSVPAAYLLDPSGDVRQVAVGMNRAADVLDGVFAWCDGECGG
jgi:peroxiredoxin